MEPTPQDRANSAEAVETHMRQMRQHFERDWSFCTPQDQDEYWTMKNVRPYMARDTDRQDRA